MPGASCVPSQEQSLLTARISHVRKSVYRLVFMCGNIELVTLLIEHVRERLSRRGLPVPETSLESVIAVMNTGKHVALVAHEASDEIVVGFAEILADSAAAVHLCIGWVNLYDTSGALVHLQDLVRARFLTDIWVVLTNPSPVAISRMLDDVRYAWRNSNARLVVATSTETLSRAELSPAARRTLIPVRI